MICKDAEQIDKADPCVMNVMFICAVLLLLAENPFVQSPFLEHVLQSWKRPAAEAVRVSHPAGMFWGQDLCSSLKDRFQTQLCSIMPPERG